MTDHTHTHETLDLEVLLIIGLARLLTYGEFYALAER